MSEDLFRSREEVQEDGQYSPRELPVIGVGKLEGLVETGDVPASVLALYKEIADESAKKVFLAEFAEAEPEKQQKILRALQRTSDKVDALPEGVADPAFKLSLTTLIAFLYTMFVARTMTRITTDPALDPGKNEEGAWLRILELSGKEVFTKPEQFEIKDVVEFIKKLIYSGHGREVLEHLDDIPAQYHADVVFHCLQVSRQKTGKLEVVYVLEALPKCKELTLDVAKQLCRLGFDQEVMEGLMTYRKDALQDVVLLLFKRGRLPFHELFGALIKEESYLMYQIIVTACFLDKKILEQLELPENQALFWVRTQFPMIQSQVNLLDSVNNGSVAYLDRIFFIPSAKFAKKALNQFGGRDYDSCHPFVRLHLIQDDVMKELAQEWPWQKMEFPQLRELSDGAAHHLSSIPRHTEVSVGRDVRMSSEAALRFSERRGWFVTTSDQGETELLVRGDRAAEELAGERAQDAFATVTYVSRATADLLRAYHQGPLYLEGVKQIAPLAAAILSGHSSPIAMGGLISLEKNQEFDPIINRLLYKGLNIVRKIGPDALRAAMKEARQNSVQEVDLPQLETIEEECVELITEFRGNISLPNIKALTIEQATAFAKHRGGVLYLQGLREASDEVIEALSHHKGSQLILGLSGRLSDRAATALGAHKGLLFLGRITQMSDEAQKAMSVHKGDLTLAIDRKGLPEEDPFYQVRGWYPSKHIRSDVAAAERAGTGKIDLDIPLSPSFLVLLEKYCKTDRLDLDVRTSLTLDELHWIALHRASHISLRGLKKLTASEASYLRNPYATLHFAYGIEMDEAATKQMSLYWERQLATGQKDLPRVAYKYLRYVS
ncbi:hypothetical protein KBA73_04785 [Patescibacteria group bacterium]|nr:hypothetical protein [Patescibacteria group bacterium]